jgi:flagellar protein FlaF
MSAYGSTAALYGAASRALGTPRSIEHDVFSKITARMRRAQNDQTAFADLAAALHDNRRLWFALATDIAGDGNSLPRDLRASLLGLAAFVDTHTARVVAREATADILIDINASIMRGLRGDRGSAENE